MENLIEKKNIAEIVENQREYFYSGATRSYEARLRALKRLRFALKENQEALAEAVKADFNKSAFEVLMCEISMTLDELNYHIKHLKYMMRDRRAGTTIAQFPAKGYISYEPYGVVLIMAPWNYPILLCLQPLVGAIAAGNCAIVKPSAYAPNTSRAIAEMLSQVFDEEYIVAVEGGREENKALLEQKFDYIFFTGSPAVGKQVMHAAAENLTPVTLELGGKSPVIIDKSADVELAARRIAFGKILNAGQTCVAPDYALIHESLQEEFLEAYEDVINIFFPFGDMHDMPVIVNDKHFARVEAYLKDGFAAIGGGSDEEHRFIEPTVLVDVDVNSPVMQEEIFGPILPLIPYSDIDEAIEFVRRRPKPLALYLFTKNSKAEKKVMGKCSFGGGCINDTIMHLASPHLPFGGVGNSGMGRYHGKKSFETFSNARSILKKPSGCDVPLRYHPYDEKKEKILKLLFK